MKTTIKYLLLIAAVIGLSEMHRRFGSGGCRLFQCAPSPATAAADRPTPETPASPVEFAKPLLLDLGAERCSACRRMKPVLDGLRRDYAESFETRFIDVSKQPDAGETYRIRLIPTQIFFDADGLELFRHEGFMAREEILAKWQELGIPIRNAAEGAE